MANQLFENPSVPGQSSAPDEGLPNRSRESEPDPVNRLDMDHMSEEGCPND